MNRVKLPDVTMVAADCLNPRAALWSFERSLSQCEFAAALLFTDGESAAALGDEAARLGSRLIVIPKIDSREKYSSFMMRDLFAYLDTEWVLITQWDGFVLNGKSWQSIFKQYDYLGARWIHHQDGMTVGNGGFSLRSKALLAALQDEPFLPQHPEDDYICRHYRPALEDHYDLVFGSAKLADDFAFERNPQTPDQSPTFGFHGAFNFNRVLTATELKELLPMLHPSTLVSRDMLELLLAYCFEGRWGEARLLKSFQDRWLTTEQLEAKLAELMPFAAVRKNILAMIAATAEVSA